MNAAVVQGRGQIPRYESFRDPVPGGNRLLVQVSAASLSHLAKMRASGEHYSSSGTYPLVAGVDGVGRLADGRRIYFAFPDAPFGTMAELSMAEPGRYVPIPDQLDDVTAAAIANPGVSSWAALRIRTHLEAGEVVLVNGATGTAGMLAVQIANHLGAGRIIATGRNPTMLKELKSLGAHDTISLNQSVEELSTAFDELFQGTKVDVVLDYLWAETAELILGAAARRESRNPVRYIHVGSIAGPTITLLGMILRSSDIHLLGSGIGSLSAAQIASSVGELFEGAVRGKLQVRARPVPLAQVEESWAAESDGRIVFVVTPTK